MPELSAGPFQACAGACGVKVAIGRRLRGFGQVWSGPDGGDFDRVDIGGKVALGDHDRPAGGERQELFAPKPSHFVRRSSAIRGRRRVQSALRAGIRSHAADHRLRGSNKGASISFPRAIALARKTRSETS